MKQPMMAGMMIASPRPILSPTKPHHPMAKKTGATDFGPFRTHANAKRDAEESEDREARRKAGGEIADRVPPK